MLCPCIAVLLNFIQIHMMKKSLKLKGSIGSCSGMFVLKDIYIYNFFPLNCWMDRSNDHNPVRITEEQTTLCSSLDLKQICN